MTAADRYALVRHNSRLAEQAASKKKEKHMSMFATPSAPGDGIKWADHLGALLLVDVLGIEAGMQTVHGPTDAVRANVAVIDGTGAGATYDDTLIFPKILASQTKNNVGQKVLGRLSQGAAKPGQSAPWILAEATADDIAKAEAWVKQNQAPAVTSAQAPF